MQDEALRIALTAPSPDTRQLDDVFVNFRTKLRNIFIETGLVLTAPVSFPVAGTSLSANGDSVLGSSYAALGTTDAGACTVNPVAAIGIPVAVGVGRAAGASIVASGRVVV